MSAAFRGLLLLLATLVFVRTTATATHAQGFFDNLFGIATPTFPASPPSYRTPVLPPRPAAPANSEPDRRTDIKSGRFRTLCVRMCDGYYFPISASVSHSDFYRDANQCRASCGSEARLFYHDASSGDASAMVDLTGRAYAALPQAFRYRKTLVDGCKCKPDPWAQSELDRHRGYALEQRAAPTRAASTPAALASNSTPVPTESSQPADRAANLPADPLAAVPPTVATSAQSTPTPPRTRSRSGTSIKSASHTPRDPQASNQRKPGKPPGLFGLGASNMRWPGD
ncbi:MAG: DUF2865 domain-containing protein [Proteobacteria bacterium]|nr:DUF2865 domain-containing protein [Pseudomonadota bacterium]